MKGFVALVAVPVVLFVGAFVVVLDLAQSRAQMKAYGPQFASPLTKSALQGGAVVLLAGALVALAVLLERRGAKRATRRRRRRAHRGRGETASVVIPPPLRAVSAPLVSAAPQAPPAAPAVPAPPVAPAPVMAAPAVEPISDPIVTVEPAGRWHADPLRHWGLREPAFDNAPNARFLYPSPAHAEALFRLRYAVMHRKGGAILTGNYGCGKTTLARALARELDRSRFDVALISNPMLTATGLLQELLHQLGETALPDDKPALLHRLQARLVESLHRGRDTVLIVDEAQLIADEAVFNELRLLLNFQTNDRFLMTLVLAGSNELRDSLRRHPHLAQRCAIRASLGPLDREQTGRYVQHRLVTAGREAETLTDAAVDELFAATGGTPRVINAVCDLLLFVGAAAGARHVDRELVRRVAGDVVPAQAA